jgi:hypothetical protein
MSEEQSAGVTVIYGAKGSVNFSAAQYFHVDGQGVLAVYVDRDNVIAVFPSGDWHRAFNMNLDRPKAVANPASQ